MTGPAAGRVSPWLALRSGAIDRVVAVVLAVVAAPIVAVFAWRVRREDGPPSFVALDRVGQDGATFAMVKLRSMRVAAPDGSAGGAALTSGVDDRITPVGAAMRRWRIDELPQLWNIARGDMGLLGPRPETPAYVDLDDPRWQEVVGARPGIAGPTQLVVEAWESAALEANSAADVYREQILPVKLAVDQWYVAHASPWIDLRIAWSMVERFAMGRADTSIQRVVRRHVPESRRVPVESSHG